MTDRWLRPTSTIQVHEGNRWKSAEERGLVGWNKSSMRDHPAGLWLLLLLHAAPLPSCCIIHTHTDSQSRFRWGISHNFPLQVDVTDITDLI